MNLEPLPLELEFRAAHLKNNLKHIDRKELEGFTGELIDVTTKLTYQTAQLLDYIQELEDHLS